MTSWTTWIPPVIGELVSQQATYAEEMVETIHRLFNGSAYDPANFVHANAERLAAMAEQSMQQQPADKQLDSQGRRFTPLKSFVSMTPEQQAQSWTPSADQVAQFAVGAIQSATANQVKAKTDELERYLAAKTGKSMPRAEKRGVCLKTEVSILCIRAKRWLLRTEMDKIPTNLPEKSLFLDFLGSICGNPVV